MSIEKIQVTLFDIFAFILPGTVVILSVWVMQNASVNDIQAIFVSLTQINASGAFVGGVIAYTVGFIINNFGYELHQRIGLRIWRIPDALVAEGQKNSQKNVLIREFSPSNLVYLEKWLSYRAFAHNLAFAMLFFGFSLIAKIFIHRPAVSWPWITLALVVIISIFPLLYRASLYQRLYYLDLNNTVKELRLEKKALNAAEAK